MDIQIRNRLAALAEPAYRDFAGALLPGSRPLLGVRLPRLRQLARELCRGDWAAALPGEDVYFEEQMLRGLVIAYAPGTPEERRERVLGFVPAIDNWSVCDSFCATLRDIPAHRDLWWPVLEAALRSPEEFTVRFGAVCLLDWYLEPGWLPRVLAALDGVTHPGYYARMGVAWALATAYLQDGAGVLALLDRRPPTDEVRRLTLRKLLESRRVTGSAREPLRRRLQEK